MIWMLRLKFLRTKHLLHYKVETFVYSLKLQFIYVNIKNKTKQKKHTDTFYWVFAFVLKKETKYFHEQ